MVGSTDTGFCCTLQYHAKRHFRDLLTGERVFEGLNYLLNNPKEGAFRLIMQAGQ